MKTSIFYLLVLGVLLCHSCSVANIGNIRDVTMYVTQDYVPLSTLAQPFEYIQLKDCGPQSIIREADKLVYLKDRVYVFDDTNDVIICYDLQGRLITSTHKYIGHGRNEYVHISDMSFDESDSLLYVLCDTPSAIMVLDAKLNIVSLHPIPLMPLEMCVSSSHILTMSVNHKDEMFEIHTFDKHHLDKQPQLLQTSKVVADRIMGLGRLLHTTHGECWAALPFDNCLYKIEDGKIAETFRIDFGEKWYSGKKLKTNDFLAENMDKVWIIQNMQRSDSLLWFNTNTEELYCLDTKNATCQCYNVIVHDSIPFASQMLIPQQRADNCLSFRIIPSFVNSYAKNIEKQLPRDKENKIYDLCKQFQNDNNALLIQWKPNERQRHY